MTEGALSGTCLDPLKSLIESISNVFGDVIFADYGGILF